MDSDARCCRAQNRTIMTHPQPHTELRKRWGHLVLQHCGTYRSQLAIWQTCSGSILMRAKMSSGSSASSIKMLTSSAYSRRLPILHLLCRKAAGSCRRSTCHTSALLAGCRFMHPHVQHSKQPCGWHLQPRRHLQALHDVSGGEQQV